MKRRKWTELDMFSAQRQIYRSTTGSSHRYQQGVRYTRKPNQQSHSPSDRTDQRSFNRLVEYILDIPQTLTPVLDLRCSLRFASLFRSRSLRLCVSLSFGSVLSFSALLVSPFRVRFAYLTTTSPPTLYPFVK